MSKAGPPRSVLVKAARLSALPGVTMAQACERHGVGRSAVARVKRELGGARPSSDDLMLAALSRNGELEHGELPTDYAHLARWLDHLEHDGCTPDEARARIEGLAGRGFIEIRGATWRLLVPWPSEAG